MDGSTEWDPGYWPIASDPDLVLKIARYRAGNTTRSAIAQKMRISQMMAQIAARHSAPRLTTNAQRGPAYHPAERPQTRRENHRSVCLVFPGASRPAGRLTPAPPKTRGTKRPHMSRTFTTKPPQAHQDPAHAHAPCSSGTVPNAKLATGTSTQPHQGDSADPPAKIPWTPNAVPLPAHTASS